MAREWRDLVLIRAADFSNLAIRNKGGGGDRTRKKRSRSFSEHTREERGEEPTLCTPSHPLSQVSAKPRNTSDGKNARYGRPKIRNREKEEHVQTDRDMETDRPTVTGGCRGGQRNGAQWYQATNKKRKKRKKEKREKRKRKEKKEKKTIGETKEERPYRARERGRDMITRETRTQPLW